MQLWRARLSGYPVGVIDGDDIRARYRRAVKFLDERGRRLFAANEALASGYGGVAATSVATGLARSTIRRAIVELQASPICSSHGSVVLAVGASARWLCSRAPSQLWRR